MMTPQRVNLWNQALRQAGSSSVWSLLDLHHITQGEHASCSNSMLATACCTCRQLSCAFFCRLWTGLHW